MFAPDDPLLARLRGIAFALPGAREKLSHGHPAFHTVKVFAYFGGSQRIGGEWVRHERAVLFLPEPGLGPALRADPRTWVPAYLGPAGWLGQDLGGHTDWEEVAEFVEGSYRQTAPRRLVADLDVRGT